MTEKTKGPGRQPGPGYNGKQILIVMPMIVPQPTKNCQISDLDNSIEIARAWLKTLFDSDDDDDQNRLADVWDEYLRQRCVWSDGKGGNTP